MHAGGDYLVGFGTARRALESATPPTGLLFSPKLGGSRQKKKKIYYFVALRHVEYGAVGAAHTT
jgi:hypothetical protein